MLENKDISFDSLDGYSSRGSEQKKGIVNNRRII